MTGGSGIYMLVAESPEFFHAVKEKFGSETSLSKFFFYANIVLDKYVTSLGNRFGSDVFFFELFIIIFL
jgi:hypothetical protein